MSSNSPIQSDIDPVKSMDNPSLIVTRMLAGRMRLPRLSDGVLLYMGNPGGVIFVLPAMCPFCLTRPFSLS